MCGTLVCVAAAMLGIDVGWLPCADGGFEYLIQIEPEALESLRRGEEIASDVPPGLRDIRSYRITVGTEELPRQGDALLNRDAAGETAANEPAGKSSLDPFARLREASRSPSDSPAGQIPKKLNPPPNSKPLAERRASFHQPGAGGEKTTAAEDRAAEAPTETPPKPWMPLTLALAALFGSFGGNIYLGWIVKDTRGRYRALLKECVEVDHEDAGG